MNREDMQDWIGDLNPVDRYPLWVISYNRPGTAPFLNRAHEWATAGDVNVLVRSSQMEMYREAYPKFRIHHRADDMIPNCGSARWQASQIALEEGFEAALLFDDDVLSLNFLFESAIMSGKNAGTECSRNSNNEDRALFPDLDERILAGMSKVAGDVFENHQMAMLGGLIKRHMNFSAKNHATKYVINGGVTPRQAMVYNMARMDKHNVEMDTDLFGVHGEDLGMNAAVLAADGDCFAIPSFAYDHWPEEVNIHESTIRNAGNAARLHRQEWESLQHYPIKDYLRTKTSIIDGSYEWGDVDWKKAAKVRGRSTIHVPWETPLI